MFSVEDTLLKLYSSAIQQKNKCKSRIQFKISNSHIKIVKTQVKLILTYLTQYIQSNIISACSQYKKILKYFKFFSFFEIGCVLFT